MHKTDSLTSNEQGFASIVIALILIIVLALMTVGFAQLARREQQNALDKQLAIQANYAAETGINDIQSRLSTYQALTTPPDSTKCLTSSVLTSATPAGLDLDPIIDSVNDVSYTCALVNLHPTGLTKSPLPPFDSWTTTFSTTGTSQPLKQFTLNWTSSDVTSQRPIGAGNVLTPSGSWNAPALLQFSITPITSVDRTDLINNTFTAYLYPTTGTDTVTYPSLNSAAKQGPILQASCANGTCKIVVNGLDGSPGGNFAGALYMVHIVDYYDTSSILVDEFKDTNGVTLSTSGGQATIDVTGQAKNVLKRLQVAVPLNGGSDTSSVTGIPDYALEAQNICKRFSTDPIQGTIPQSVPGGAGGSFDPCNFNN